MNLLEFKASLVGNNPPPGLTKLLEALWYDGKGDWHAAHTICQDINTPDGMWMHAYLHKKEGDYSNAAYWYSRAGIKDNYGSLEGEWEQMVAKLL